MQPVAEIQPAVSLLGKTPQLPETLLGDLHGEVLQWRPERDSWPISELSERQ